MAQYHHLKPYSCLGLAGPRGESHPSATQGLAEVGCDRCIYALIFSYSLLSGRRITRWSAAPQSKDGFREKEPSKQRLPRNYRYFLPGEKLYANHAYSASLFTRVCKLVSPMLYGSLKVYRVVNLNCYLSPVSFTNVRRLPALILLLIAETIQRWVV